MKLIRNKTGGQDERENDGLIICNAMAMRFWALQYGPYVEVLEPLSLRKQVIEDIEGMSRKYEML